jgi:hemolysin type calcium-binding protein
MGRLGRVAVVIAGAAAIAMAGTAQAAPHCHGRKATIAGGRGANHLHGTAGPDVIAGGGGNDRIDGRRGFDLICGGSGADVILGGPGGDAVYGGSGDDSLYGGLQDDKLVGESGNDLLIGGEAVNTLLGGPGDDYNREGFTVNGGPGSDWLSFATNTYPLAHYGLTVGTHDNRRESNLENAVGTRFADVIYGGPAAASGTVRGLGSRVDPSYRTQRDECYEFAVTDCDGPFAGPGHPVVVADPVPPDPGVTVLGGPASERYSISKTASGAGRRACRCSRRPGLRPVR